MYQALLTRRYLFSKIMPLLAAVAVALCSAMVLIVWSVMGGFLAMLVDSGRTLTGDVAVNWPTAGFAYYEDLIERLEADPMVEAAAPMIETFGVLSLPSGRQETVIVRAVEGASYARVTDYEDTLYWVPRDRPMPQDREQEDWRLRSHESWAMHLEHGLALAEPGNDGVLRPAIVPGIAVADAHVRKPWGGFVPGAPLVVSPDGQTRLLDRAIFDDEVTLYVAPQDDQGRVLDMVARVFPVANEFQSGLYEIDRRTVLVELGAIQAMLNMNEGRRLADTRAFDPFDIGFDPETGEERIAAPREFVRDPARVTTVLVRGIGDGRDPRPLARRVREIYREFADAHAGRVPPEGDGMGTIRIQTWEDQNRTLIEAVKKETALVLILFSIISFTAVFLVLAIFWAMVSEKTRDIGILRSIGASRGGVAWLWLRYGTAIGLLGTVLGMAIAFSVILNINAIHDAIGAIGAFFGRNTVIWDPSIYVFSRIPTEIVPWKVAVVFAGGLLSSVVGALIPAIRAAWMHPVRALGFE